jgi:uncharacterized membrane protein YkoI
MNDINTTNMASVLKNTLESKFAKSGKNKENEDIKIPTDKALQVEKKYFDISPDGAIIPKDEAIKIVIKKTLEGNAYVYSTEDLIGAFLEN